MLEYVCTKFKQTFWLFHILSPFLSLSQSFSQKKKTHTHTHSLSQTHTHTNTLLIIYPSYVSVPPNAVPLHIGREKLSKTPQTLVSVWVVGLWVCVCVCGCV